MLSPSLSVCGNVSLQSLPAGRPFSVITQQTIVDRPSNFHSRYRGPDYIDQYDRFFFQWWNFLVYDAETNDHWTVVYHTTKFSKAANYSDYASTSMIHKQGSAAREHAHDAVPLADLIHTKDWDLGLRKKDGSVPHRMTIIDDDTYNVIADMPPSKTSNGQRIAWNLTFHRVHGMYSGSDSEEGNKDHCAVVSTLFGYHSKVSGWISSGSEKWEFGVEGAAGKRFRAYAAGSWGCKLPSGSPALAYPWTWFWLVIPSQPASASGPGNPDIGMAMGTAKFQLNNTLLGDLYGGYASVGITSDESVAGAQREDAIITSNLAILRANDSLGLEVPLAKVSTDGYLRRFELGYEDWSVWSDSQGAFEVPLVQTYDVESRLYRFQLRFESRPEQYFRCPVVLEREVTPSLIAEATAAATQAKQDTLAAVAAIRRLQVFSDYRAVGVRTHVQIWKRSNTPEEIQALRKLPDSASAIAAAVPPPAGVNATQWIEGAWQRVVYEGVVTTMNALEYAYESPLDSDVFNTFVQKQVFD